MFQSHVVSAERPARLLVGVLAVLTLAAFVYGAWMDYRGSVGQGEILATQLVRAVEVHATRSLGFATAMLTHVADAVPSGDPPALGEAEQVHILSEMEVFLNGVGETSSVLIADREGRVIVGAGSTTSIDAAKLGSFAAVRDGAPFFIGSRERDPLGGLPVIAMARRIDGLGGEFAGAVLAAVAAEHFEEMFSSLGLEEGSAVALFHTLTGQLLARVPSADAETQSAADWLLFRRLREGSRAGTFTVTSALDGTERLFAYRVLADHPAVAVVGVSRKAVLAGWVERQGWAALVAALLGGLVVLLGRRVIETTRATADANERLHAALTDRTLLLTEVHHRVKNNLQIVQSLLTMESLMAPPESQAGYQDSLQRIQAMGMVHELLYQSGDFGAIRCKEYLERLCGLLVGEHPGIGLVVEGDEAALDLDRAVPFAMAINEITLNALKHAFGDRRSGKLTVAVEHRRGMLTVAVADNGAGLPPGFKPATSGSLGTRLLLGLASQLGGKVEFDSGDGTTVRLSFPLA